jgi:hypothetical protein
MVVEVIPGRIASVVQVLPSTEWLMHRHHLVDISFHPSVAQISICELISIPLYALILAGDVLTTGVEYAMKTMHTPERNEQRNMAQGGFQILLGVLFLLVIYGTTIFGSSIWLVMGLLPLYWIGLKAYRVYQEDGSISNRVLTTLLPCLFPFVFIVAIIAGIDMSRLWPIVLILAGVTTILTSRR